MKNVFVGNMSFQTTEAELRALFEPFGQVTRVHIAMDRETGRARGFAFVEMPNDAEATKAMSGLDGKEVGYITSALHSPRLNASIALAYVRKECNQIGSALTVRSAAGEIPASVVALPFV